MKCHLKKHVKELSKTKMKGKNASSKHFCFRFTSCRVSRVCLVIESTRPTALLK